MNILDAFIPDNDFDKFNEILIVLEYANYDLKRVLKKNIYLLEKDVIKYTYDILLGLNYIHSAGVWHRDLKPANVLIFDNELVKICDFGLAWSVDESFSETQ